jgi:hypothetical protein
LEENVRNGHLKKIKRNSTILQQKESRILREMTKCRIGAGVLQDEPGGGGSYSSWK